MDLDDLLGEHENAEAVETENNDGGNANNGNDDEGRNQNDESGMGTQAAESSLASKRKKRGQGTRLTLDHQKLCGERGIPILSKHFDNVKFKGKGHEKEDLGRLMFHLEHWTHRLFPSLTFDDILDRIEWLGTKRPVKNCLTKIRLDMPVLSEDFVTKETEPNAQDSGEENAHVPSHDQQMTDTSEDLFEQFIQDFETGNVENRSDSVPNIISSETDLSSTQEKVLPQHLLDRIERNRKLAMEKRKARLHHGNVGSESGPSQPLTIDVELSNMLPPPEEDQIGINHDSERVMPHTTPSLKDISLPESARMQTIPNEESEIMTVEDLLDEIENSS